MEENKHCTDASASRPKCKCGIVPFLIGILVALSFGWWVFPDLMWSKKEQPFFFSHKAHVEDAGMTCDSCHTFRADGSFTGIPSVQECANCHADLDSMQIADADTPEREAAQKREAAFITDYVLTGKEVSWKVHQKQPDNVFFSHAAHFKKCYSCHLTMQGQLNLGTPENPEKLCKTCHLSLAELDKNTPVQENILTGYSRTTKKMWECERCHAHPGHFSNNGKGRTNANNACYTCHK